MTMLLVLLLVVGGGALVFAGWGLPGVLLIAGGVWIVTHARGDIVEDLLSLLFGVGIILGALVLLIEVFG